MEFNSALTTRSMSLSFYFPLLLWELTELTPRWGINFTTLNSTNDLYSLRKLRVISKYCFLALQTLKFFRKNYQIAIAFVGKFLRQRSRFRWPNWNIHHWTLLFVSLACIWLCPVSFLYNFCTISLPLL